MASKLSRRKLAQYVADSMEASKGAQALQEVAAYLLETRRTREVERLVRDIEEVLAERGTVVADVTTAKPLAPELEKALRQLVDARQLEIRSTVDPEVLGGIRLSVPGRLMDATIAHKLALLKTKQL